MTRRRGRRVAAAGLAIALATAASCGPGADEPGGTADPGDDPPVATTPSGSASFPLPEDTPLAVELAGLQLLPKEHADVGVHAHVRVVVDGKDVTVPADIGIDADSGRFSPVHTHDDSGLIHVDAEPEPEPEVATTTTTGEGDDGDEDAGNGDRPDAAGADAAPRETFRVGQLFQQWNVPLDKTCLGSLCTNATHQLLGFVDGQLVPDPASIPLVEHAVIVIWFGPKGTNPTVPVTYAFPD